MMMLPRRARSAQRAARRGARPSLAGRLGETIRIRLLTIEGTNVLDLRRWSTAKDGIMQPGKGFCCRVKHLPKLISALTAATRKAEELGLLASAEPCRTAE